MKKIILFSLSLLLGNEVLAHGLHFEIPAQNELMHILAHFFLPIILLVGIVVLFKYQKQILSAIEEKISKF